LKGLPAGRPNRRRARWPTAAAFALAAIVALASAPAAGANVVVGQLPATAPAPTCSTTADYLQPSITGGNLYNVRQAGTITSWSTRSSGDDATYVFKVFRRTSDPDVFQVIARGSPHELTPGVNTVRVNIAVRSGDIIGLNESGDANSCTFPVFGDGVLSRGGSLGVGTSGAFLPLSNVRLNLSAVLVPSNDFTVASIKRDPKHGTATLNLNVPNPGVVTFSGKAMKKRPSKNVAVAGSVHFAISPVGQRKRKLEKRGKLTVLPTLTFFPAGGDPASQTFPVKLKQRKRRPRLPSE
jgi:hypothetical protein